MPRHSCNCGCTPVQAWCLHVLRHKATRPSRHTKRTLAVHTGLPHKSSWRLRQGYTSFVAPQRVQNLCPAINGLWQLVQLRDVMDARRLPLRFNGLPPASPDTGVPHVVQKREFARSGARHLVHMPPPPSLLLSFFFFFFFLTGTAGAAPVATAAAGGAAPRPPP